MFNTLWTPYLPLRSVILQKRIAEKKEKAAAVKASHKK